MKRRMATVLSVQPDMLDNKWTEDKKLDRLIKKMFYEAVSLFFEEEGGFDFKINHSAEELEIVFGFEPTYQYEEFNVVKISTKIEHCCKEKGIANGAYGTDIKSVITPFNMFNEAESLFANKWQSQLLEYFKKANNHVISELDLLEELADIWGELNPDTKREDEK